MIGAAMLALTPPALPPSGPVYGQIQCLLNYGSGTSTAVATFDESAQIFIGPEGIGNRTATQVLFQQIPVDGDEIGHVEFAQDGAITIFSKNGKKALGRFSFVSRAATGSADAMWMTFSIPLVSGEFAPIGNCFGSITGRVERPVRMNKTYTIRIDRIYE